VRILPCVETTLEHYVDLLADRIHVTIRIGRLQDSDLVVRRLAPCRRIFCAALSFLARDGLPTTVEQLRQAPQLVFSQAVSPEDWTLNDPDGDTRVVDGGAVVRGVLQ